MRAVVHDRYGPPEVLRIADVPKPIPEDGELLVRVHASTVTRSDCGLRGAHYWFARVFTGLLRPKRKIAGSEFAGVVEAVGGGVTRFAPGDEVFGIKGGSNAEYVCVREDGVVAHKPAGIGFEEAAAVCDGAAMALTCLRPEQLRAGRSLLVYGASGSIGTAAVQLAAASGVAVDAVCNAKNVELVRSLGAARVFDYEREDFATSGTTYDVVFDAVGKSSYRRSRRALEPGGEYVTADLGFLWHTPIVALWTRWFGAGTARIGIGKYWREDILRLKELIDTGRYRAVIDRVYPLEEVVEATRYVETQQKTGNVVLRVEGGTRQ